MKLSSIARSAGVLGVVAACMVGLSGAAMAATIHPAGLITITDPTSEGSITITTTNAEGSTGVVTWTYSGLADGLAVTVYAVPDGNSTSLTQINSGYVTSNGTYVANVTLPAGDTWQNTEVEMTSGQFAIGQLPEVPWAAGLPLFLALPLGYSLWRRGRAGSAN